MTTPQLEGPEGYELPPGTPFFGIAYADGSAGCWNPTRAEVEEVRRQFMRLGFGPLSILTVRMKSEALWVTR